MKVKRQRKRISGRRRMTTARRRRWWTTTKGIRNGKLEGGKEEVEDYRREAKEARSTEARSTGSRVLGGRGGMESRSAPLSPGVTRDSQWAASLMMRDAETASGHPHQIQHNKAPRLVAGVEGGRRRGGGELSKDDLMFRIPALPSFSSSPS